MHRRINNVISQANNFDEKKQYVMASWFSLQSDNFRIGIIVIDRVNPTLVENKNEGVGGDL